MACSSSTRRMRGARSTIPNSVTQQMVDPRIYRAALLPVLFALVLLAFSVENRPRPLTTPIAPAAFVGDRAFDRAYEPGRGFADRYPNRRPGSVGDERLAGTI